MNFGQLQLLLNQAGLGGGGGRRVQLAKLSTLSSCQPNDWRAFKRRANAARTLNQWTDQEAKSMILTVGEGEAADRIQSVEIGGDPDLVPPPPDAKTYEQYMEEVQLKFQHREASSLAIADFQRCRMRSDEDFVAFHSRLSNIHKLAYPLRDQQTDVDLIRHFCLGINDRVIANYLMDQQPNRYDECLVLAQGKQGRMAQVSQSHGPRTGRIAAFGDAVDGDHDLPEDEDDFYVFDASEVGAINYETGSRKPTTKSRNRVLRRGGIGGNAVRQCGNCERFDHGTSDCPYIHAMGRRTGKGSRQVTFPKGPRNNNRARQGRGRGKGGKGNSRGKTGRKKSGMRRGGAHAFGEDSDNDCPESLAALDCLEQMALTMRNNKEGGN